MKEKLKKYDIKVDLPRLMRFDDYHDIDALGKQLKQICPKIKIEELGCVGRYVGIVYVKKDEAYKSCVKDFKEEERLWEEETYGEK